MTQDSSQCLSDLWTLETIGIRDPIHVNDDDKALESLTALFLTKMVDTVSDCHGNLMNFSYKRILILLLEG